jgi:hypothetical protein
MVANRVREYTSETARHPWIAAGSAGIPHASCWRRVLPGGEYTREPTAARSERRLDVVPPPRQRASTACAHLPALIDVSRFRQVGPGTATRPGAGNDGGGCGGDVHGCAPSRVDGPRWRGCGFGVSRRRRARRRNRAGGQPADPVRQDVFRQEKILKGPGRAKREAGCAPDRACETDQVGIRRDPATGDLTHRYREAGTSPPPRTRFARH